MKKEKNLNIKKVAVIAGGGHMPRQVYEYCKRKNIECFIVGISEYISKDILSSVDYEVFSMCSIGKILSYIKDNSINNVVLAGKVSRSNIVKLLLDRKGVKLFAKILKYGLSDNNALTAVIDFLESEGLIVLPSELFTEDMIIPKGNISGIKISDQNKYDIEKGRKILKDVSTYDIGQSLVMQDGLVLGVEVAEETDCLIERCGKIQQNLSKTRPVLIKSTKVNQDMRVDLPCIGPETIKKLNESNFSGIAVESESAMILEKEKTLELAKNTSYSFLE